MDPGIIHRLAPPPPAAGAIPARPVAPGPTNPAAAAPTAETQRLTPEEQRARRQQLAACRQQAVRDFPRGGPDFNKALADCGKILQQK
jgi:hypothetical protein